MMGAHPRRRCQENPLCIPNPQLQPKPQQIQEIHPPPPDIPLMIWKASLMLSYIFLARPFSVLGVAIPTLHLLIPPEAPLIQSQGTLMRMAHIPFINLIMNQIGIDNIPLHTPYPTP